MDTKRLQCDSAGATSEIVVYPLEVVRRRMQLSSMVQGTVGRAPGAAAAASSARKAAAAAAGVGAVGATGWARVVETCAAIRAAEGLKGFYVGLGPNMLQVLPSAALSYWTYDTCKMLLGVHM